jgi:Family of unknown function (DUF6112)
MNALMVLAQKVTLNPDSGNLPGGEVLQSLTDGLAGFALIACLIGWVVSAGFWALGAHTNNYQQAYAGKRGFIVCAAATLCISGAAAFINFFYGAGQNI